MNRLIYLDETGVNIGMTRLYGRAPKGERIYEYVPDVRFNRVSVLSTIRVDGTTNPFVYSGTLNGFLFIQYIWLTCAFYSITPEQAENHFINAIYNVRALSFVNRLYVIFTAKRYCIPVRRFQAKNL